MHACFFESVPSEESFWTSNLPGVEVSCFPEPLLEIGRLEGMAEQVEILSVFVHSKVSAEVIAALPNLKFIETRSTGFNHIDLRAAAERGILVSNVPAYGDNTVAEHAFSLLLALSRKVVDAVARTRAGDFSTDGLMGFDLRGKTIGIVGTGRIGRRMMQMAKGFEMNLLCFDAYPDHAAVEGMGGRYVSLEELMSQSDVVSVHAAYTGENRHMISRELLENCKSGLVFLNTARGELVDTVALMEALKAGRVRAAGLDVLEDEGALASGNFGPEAKELLAMSNVLVTPHMAFDSQEAVGRILRTSAENIVAYMDGRPQNLVKPL